MFALVKRKFNALPDPPGFSTSLTPGSYTKVSSHFKPNEESVLLEVGCGKGYAMIYYALIGFKTVIGWDIAPESVIRAQYVIDECTKDDRMQDTISGVQFNVLEKDALKTAIPDEVTHLNIVIAWTIDQLEVLFASILRSKSVCMFSLLLGGQSRAQKAMIAQEARFKVVDCISVSLESSGEKRQVMIVTLV